MPIGFDPLGALGVLPHESVAGNVVLVVLALSAAKRAGG